MTDWGLRGTRWWGPEAAEDAIASFLPVLSAILTSAYERVGSPYGAASVHPEGLEQWIAGVPDGDGWEELDGEISRAWSLHLEVRFAARQVN